MTARPYAHHATLLDRCTHWADRDKAGSWIADREHTIVRSWAKTTCWWCTREHRTTVGTHRKRPDLPYLPGRCRLCEGELTGRRTSWCSDACALIWMGASTSVHMLSHLLDLHGRECWCCGRRWEPGRFQPWRGEHGPPSPHHVTLDVDHIRPLWSLTEDERTQHRWWLPFNIQLLCSECHKAKTKAEAGERALLRRNEALEDGAQQTLLVP